MNDYDKFVFKQLEQIELLGFITSILVYKIL